MKDAERKREREAKNQQNLAAKAMPALNSTKNMLQQAVLQIQKNGSDKFGEDLVKALEEALQEFEKYRNEAGLVSNTEIKKMKEGMLSFSKDTLDASMKSVSHFMGEYKDIMRGIKEEKALAALAKGKPKKSAKNDKKK